MKNLFILLLVLFVICLSIHETNAKLDNLELSSFYSYKKTGCDYATEPCTGLSDIWGYKYEDNGEDKYVAIVTAKNGIDFVDVTKTDSPKHIKFIPGCLNTWRDVKTWKKTVYGITEYTSTCNCDVGDPCSQSLDVEIPFKTSMKMTEGAITPQLSSTGPVKGDIVAVEPWSDGACDVILNKEQVNGKIAIIPYGDCSFSEKILNAQNAGAKAVIIVNDMDDIVYPGMVGHGDGINIPGVMVAKSDGVKLYDTLKSGESVSVTMSSDNLKASTLYLPPQGLTIISMDDPTNPTLVARNRNTFSFSHNVYVEEDRPFMYICGMSDRKGSGRSYVNNGGIQIFDISGEYERDPKLIATFSTTYIHDIFVKKCGDKYILMGAAVYDTTVWLWDVTDPANFKKLVSFKAEQKMAHNVAMDDACTALYVTHEKEYHPITVWGMWLDENQQTIWEAEPKYLGSISVQMSSGTLPHNVFVKGNHLWASYYGMGCVIWDITDPVKPTLLTQYDTSNYVKGFHGAWGVYPYDERNGQYAYISDIEEGLYVLQLKDSATKIGGARVNGATNNNNDENKSVVIGLSTAFAIAMIAFIAAVIYIYILKRRSYQQLANN